MAAIEYRGLNAVTNFDLSRYIKWLRPNNHNVNPNPSKSITDGGDSAALSTPVPDLGFSLLTRHPNGETSPAPIPRPGGSASSALGLLLQSSKFKEMLEMTSAEDRPPTPSDSDFRRRSFPDDIQTYFDCRDTGLFGDGDGDVFGDLNSFASPMFDCELES